MAASPTPVPRPARVLLADDHPGVLAAVAELLESSGALVVVARCRDGAEAVQQAHRTAPDVAVLDLTMPVLDGLDATRRLRAVLPRLPVLVLTASGEGAAVEAARAAGAAGLVVKGADPGTLPAQVLRVLGGEQVWPPLHTGSPCVEV